MADSSSTQTSLPLEETAKLLQKLVKLKDEEKLPKSMNKIVDDYLNAHSMFVKQIDKFLHSDDHDAELEYDAIKTVVETCPEFLTTKKSFGNH